MIVFDNVVLQTENSLRLFNYIFAAEKCREALVIINYSLHVFLKRYWQIINQIQIKATNNLKQCFYEES